MLLRNNAPFAGKTVHSKLDAAIIASVLATGALGLLAMAGQLGPTKAYAAAPCDCAAVGIALA